MNCGLLKHGADVIGIFLAGLERIICITEGIAARVRGGIVYWSEKQGGQGGAVGVAEGGGKGGDSLESGAVFHVRRPRYRVAVENSRACKATSWRKMLLALPVEGCNAVGAMPADKSASVLEV